MAEAPEHNVTFGEQLTGGGAARFIEINRHIVEINRHALDDYEVAPEAAARIECTASRFIRS